MRVSWQEWRKGLCIGAVGLLGATTLAVSATGVAAAQAVYGDVTLDRALPAQLTATQDLPGYVDFGRTFDEVLLLCRHYTFDPSDPVGDTEGEGVTMWIPDEASGGGGFGSDVPITERTSCSRQQEDLDLAETGRVDFIIAAAVDGYPPDTTWTLTGIDMWVDTRPVNDDFANATVVGSLPFRDEVSTDYATSEPGEPSNCGFIPSDSPTVWWKYTHSGPAATIVADTAGSGFDTAMEIYRGTSLPGLTFVGCNDDVDSLQARIRWPAEPGSTYYLRIDGYRGNVGDLVLEMREASAPANDHFANATVVGALPFGDALDTAGATSEDGEPSNCSFIPSDSPTVWWTYTHSGPTTTIVADSAGSGFDTAIEVYRGTSLSNLDFVNCNDDVDSLQARVGWRAVAGSTYYLRIDGYRGRAGDLVLQIDERQCTITGTNGRDFLYGTPYDDFICGLGGDDLIRSGSGKDIVYGGPGNDVIYGGPGSDHLKGELGNDRLHGEGGWDTINGGKGRDQMLGHSGNDTFWAKDFWIDTLDGGGGTDRARIDRGKDSVTSVERLF